VAKRKPERITGAILMELIQRHSCCVLDQQHKCPLQMFTEPMSWELNCYFGVGDETDKAFRRCDDIPAARPLSNHSTAAAENKECRKNDPEEE
jgi:hypothetical protein